MKRSPPALRSASRLPTPLALAVLAVLAATPAAAPAQAQQVVKPPVAQLWMDVATHVMPGMPAMPAMPGGMGGMFGGGGAGGGNVFGNARGMTPGRYVDIALHTQRKPAGTEGTQTVPQGTGLAPSLPLLPPRTERSSTPGDREPHEMERPRGRILLYWGCGEEVRPGQPRVLDFSKSKIEEWGTFMQGRAPRERGAVARAGNAVWPNDKDRRNFGTDASLTGDHAVTGDGVPAGLKFAIAQANDFMPAIDLAQEGALTGAVRLSWSTVANAQAYFLNAMSGSESADGGAEMVLWSSSELPDPGMSLIDFASPANVAQWLKERVLLAPTVTRCAIPKGIFAKAEGGMLRMIAYGPELNLTHPPRPTDVKIPWEPEWAVRVRTKSTAMSMLGMESMSGGGSGRRGRTGAAAPAGAGSAAAAAPRPDCPPPGDPSAQAGAEVGGAAIGGGLGRTLGSAVGGLLGAMGGKPDAPKAAPPGDCPR